MPGGGTRSEVARNMLPTHADTRTCVYAHEKQVIKTF